MDAQGNPQVFTQTLQPNPPQQQPTLIDPELIDQQQRQQLMARIASRGQQVTDPEEVRRNKARNSLDMDFGRLMMLTGDPGAQQLGGSVLKQAMAMQQPQVTERGTYDPMSGQFTYNPEYLNERDTATLQQIDNRISAREEARRAAAQERTFRSEENRLNREAAAERARIMAGAQGAKLPNNTAQAVTSFGVMDKVLTQIEGELKNFDPRNPNDQMDTGKRARIDSLVSQYRLEAKNAAELGALAGPDLGLIDEMLAPISSAKGILLGREGLLQQIKTTRQWGKERMGQISRMYPGANMGTAAPTLAPDALEVDASDLTPTNALPQAVAASGARRR